MEHKVLIAGIGNMFLGDDGFGVAVSRRLVARSLPKGVQVEDFGIRGYDLAFALMEPWERVILVDAIARGGEPGSVYVIEPDLGSLEAASGEPPADAHSMDPLNVLRMVKAMGKTLPPLTLVACEPADLGGEEGRIGLTPAVEAAVETALQILEQMLSPLFSLSTSVAIQAEAQS